MEMSNSESERRMGAYAKNAERSFALAVEDLTEHSAEWENGGVTVTVQPDEYSGATTMNELGELVRAYDMAFYTGTVTEGTTLLRFGDYE